MIDGWTEMDHEWQCASSKEALSVPGAHHRLRVWAVYTPLTLAPETRILPLVSESLLLLCDIGTGVAKDAPYTIAYAVIGFLKLLLFIPGRAPSKAKGFNAPSVLSPLTAEPPSNCYPIQPPLITTRPFTGLKPINHGKPAHHLIVPSGSFKCHFCRMI